MNGFIVVQINDYKDQYLHLPGKMMGWKFLKQWNFVCNFRHSWDGKKAKIVGND